MYKIREVILDSEQEELESFLKENNLDYETDITYSIMVYDGTRIIATASLGHQIMKCFAVDKEYSGQNITGLMFHHLIEILQSSGISHYFVFTTPENESIFKSFNMKKIVRTMNTVLLEGGDNIDNVLTRLKSKYNVSDIKKGCIIMNANPMTNGHLYLVEEALKQYEEVLIFVVSEDVSSFPFEDRFDIIYNATKHLEGVTVLPSLSYLVSRITFPKYFLKEDQLIKDEQTLIDVLIYKEYYQKTFNIDKRFVGSEPYSINTSKYNKVLKDYLGIKVQVVERKELDKKAISASQVRRLIKGNHINKVKNLVPKATYDYLNSERGQQIITTIQDKKLGRH